MSFSETVQIAHPLGGWCNPTVYVDGARAYYAPAEGFTLSSVVSIDDVITELLEVVPVA